MNKKWWLTGENDTAVRRSLVRLLSRRYVCSGHVRGESTLNSAYAIGAAPSTSNAATYASHLGCLSAGTTSNALSTRRSQAASKLNRQDRLAASDRRLKWRSNSEHSCSDAAGWKQGSIGYCIGFEWRKSTSTSRADDFDVACVLMVIPTADWSATVRHRTTPLNNSVEHWSTTVTRLSVYELVSRSCRWLTDSIQIDAKRGLSIFAPQRVGSSAWLHSDPIIGR